MEVCHFWKLQIALGIIFLVSDKGSADCFSESSPLPDAARRSLSNNYSSSYISDRTLATGWYSALVNNFYYALADKKPRFASCGTYNPIYLKDPLPKLAEGKNVDLIACFLNYDDDCKAQYKIKARLCHGTPQYYLVPTDGQSAYCFERTNISDVAKAPGETIRGQIIVSVALFYEKMAYAFEPFLQFKCNFNPVRNKPDYFYEVIWYINDRAEITRERGKFADIDRTNLNESEILRLNYSMGITVKCGVRISSTVNGNQTRQQPSDTFFVGVKINNPVITINRGGSTTITLQPTVPLGCSLPFRVPDGKEPCDLAIELYDPNSAYQCGDTQVAVVSDPNLSDQKLCGRELSGWRKKSNQHCKGKHDKNRCSYSSIRIPSISMRVKTTNQLTYKADETFSLQLKTSSTASQKVWENQYLDRVQVHIRDNGAWYGRRCDAIVDPQIYTFDGGHWTMKDVGEFIMYRHTTLNMQVQIKTFYCARHAYIYGTCICATAVEAGGDIFLIDVCKVKNINFISCRGNVLNVRKGGQHHYIVYFPTGTYVQIEIVDVYLQTFLKVKVYSSPSDVSKTEGICGNFNGDSRDDSETPPRATDSLFDILNHDLATQWEYTQTVCICPKLDKSLSSTSSPSNGLLNEAVCTKKEYATCTETVKLEGEQKTCVLREKRSTKRHHENIQRRMVYSREATLSAERRDVKDTDRSDVTFERAWNICLTVFTSKKAYKLRSKISDKKLNSSLEACARDAMIDSTNDAWLQAHFESWTDIVLNEFRRNTTFVKESPSIVESFKANVCPHQCFNNGDCVNGMCICKDDFVGDSCFVKRSAVLNITDIEGGGKCDLSYGDDCHHCLQFHTENLLGDFKCHIRFVETQRDGTVQNTSDTIKKGEYESVYEGYCCPEEMDNHVHRRSAGNSPFVTEYQISVSNDGRNFGSPRSVYVYDSNCQEYSILPNGNLLFSLKDDTCFINGKCYKVGQQLLTSDCYICNPLQSKFEWTDGCKNPPVTIPDDEADDDEGSKVMVYAIALSLTSVVVIGVIAVLVICKYHTKKRRNVGNPPKDPPIYDDLNFGPSNQQYMPYANLNKKPLFIVSK